MPEEPDTGCSSWNIAISQPALQHGSRAPPDRPTNEHPFRMNGRK